MAIATITTGSWQSVTTTTTDTVFQNQTPREVYITTASTGSLPEKEGYLLRPWVGSIVIGSGLAVSARAFGGTATILYMSV